VKATAVHLHEKLQCSWHRRLTDGGRALFCLITPCITSITRIYDFLDISLCLCVVCCMHVSIFVRFGRSLPRAFRIQERKFVECIMYILYFVSFCRDNQGSTMYRSLITFARSSAARLLGALR